MQTYTVQIKKEFQMDNIMISGFVKNGFESVRNAFIDNFKLRNELGAACSIYYRGEKVVDLWGGLRNETTKAPWEENSMVIIFSATKGLSALTLALAHSRGLFKYDDKISKYWPEFAQEGKKNITIRQLLAHQAGLFEFEGQNDRDLLSDLDRLAIILAKQKPAWKPGTRQAYHAITLGYYENEIMRRVDPHHRTIGQFFQEEIADPLSLNVYIRLPKEIPDYRLAVLRQAKPVSISSMFSFPPSVIFAFMNPRSFIRRSLIGSSIATEDDHIYARNFEVPSGGGVATAQGIAHVYSGFATGGEEIGLKEETLKQMMEIPITPKYGFKDMGLKVKAPFSLGFSRPSKDNPFGSPTSFGAPGFGGSFGFADPTLQIGYGYVPNGLVNDLVDQRDLSLRIAMYRSIGEYDLAKKLEKLVRSEKRRS